MLASDEKREAEVKCKPHFPSFVAGAISVLAIEVAFWILNRFIDLVTQ